METNKIYNMDCLFGLKTLPDEYIQTCVTSPPYWGLRDYRVDGQLGLELTPEEYVEKTVNIFREVKRVLRDDGTLWVNLGDSYAGNNIPGGGDPTIGQRNLGGEKYKQKNIPPGLKQKDLVGIPWMVAFALREDGWYLRSDIIWEKPNAMPESVTDRPTKAHEYLFLFSKSKKYYYDATSIREKATSKPGKGATGRGKQAYAIASGMFANPQQDHSGWMGGDGLTRNKRSVWSIPTKPFKGAHFAVFPPELIEPCIKAGAPEGSLVLDPFMGAGTTALVARQLGRKYIGFELNPDYVQLAQERLA